MRIIYGVLAVILLILFVVIAVINRHDVDTYFPLSETILVIPLYAVFFISLLVGVLLSSIISLKYKYQLCRTRKEIKRLKNQMENTKTLEHR